jgi:hypothetical protein
MKKTIIALSIATIAFGGIYLFDNKDSINVDLQPNNKSKSPEIADEKIFQKTELKSNKVLDKKKI